MTAELSIWASDSLACKAYTISYLTLSRKNSLTFGQIDDHFSWTSVLLVKKKKESWGLSEWKHDVVEVVWACRCPVCAEHCRCGLVDGWRGKVREAPSEAGQGSGWGRSDLVRSRPWSSPNPAPQPPALWPWASCFTFPEQLFLPKCQGKIMPAPVSGVSVKIPQVNL